MSKKILNEMFEVNRKKYQIMKPWEPQSRSLITDDLELKLIKQSSKIQGHKKAMISVEAGNNLKQMEEINIRKKEGQCLTQDERKQVKLLRKKVEISNILGSKAIKDDEKKVIYRKLVKEFHPDKTKYERHFATETFLFLQNNKYRFLKAES